jgi:hypothetical protein
MSEYSAKWTSLSGRVRWQPCSFGAGHDLVYPKTSPTLYRSKKVAEFIGKRRERKVKRRTYVRSNSTAELNSMKSAYDRYSGLVVGVPPAKAEPIRPIQMSAEDVPPPEHTYM